MGKRFGISMVSLLTLILFVLLLTGCDEWANDPGGPLGPGNWKLTIDQNGTEREMRVHVPESYDGSSQVPLLLSFHGFLGTGEKHATTDGFVNKADEKGFIVVYPEGIGPKNFHSWNAGTACCGEAENCKSADVKFARDIVSTISTRCSIDLTRVYAHGHSNGGGMVHRLGREASDVFAAISPQSMPVLVPDEVPSRPVPVIHFHGTGDYTININGGHIFGEDDAYISGQESFENWASVNACTGNPAIVSYGDSNCQVYSDCGNGVEVVFCSLEGGSHNDLHSHKDINLADMAWDFMSKYSMQ